jgi:hypothetical protein
LTPLSDIRPHGHDPLQPGDRTGTHAMVQIAVLENKPAGFSAAELFAI